MEKIGNSVHAIKILWSIPVSTRFHFPDNKISIEKLDKFSV